MSQRGLGSHWPHGTRAGLKLKSVKPKAIKPGLRVQVHTLVRYITSGRIQWSQMVCLTHIYYETRLSEGLEFGSESEVWSQRNYRVLLLDSMLNTWTHISQLVIWRPLEHLWHDTTDGVSVRLTAFGIRISGWNDAMQCCGFCHLGKVCTQLMLAMLRPWLFTVLHVHEQGRRSHSKLVSAGMSQTAAVPMNMIKETAVAHW